jgi:NAD(P)-dependent dehydrogenase (short-subunit alcohol dehydrogenase family)
MEVDTMLRLKDKVAIVSGAGSSRPGMGNGKATAILFTREGARVVAVDKDLEAAEETVKLIAGEGGQAIAMQADVTTEAEARKVVEAAIANYGRLDILFNNVGIGLGGGGLKVSEEEWDAVMNTNLKSILFMCKYAVPEMKKAGGGAIVNNASMAAFYGHRLYAYATSKAGVTALTRSMAVGLAKDNIRVNCVAPGFIATPMVQPIMDEKREQGVQARVPMRRHGKAEEIAYTVLFLASDEASYITGQTICVDGGLSVM